VSAREEAYTDATDFAENGVAGWLILAAVDGSACTCTVSLYCGGSVGAGAGRGTGENSSQRHVTTRFV
jgi:hypothetical protein